MSVTIHTSGSPSTRRAGDGMRHGCLLVVAAALAACGGSSAGSSTPAGLPFQVGYAEVDVSPPEGIAMGGFGMPGGLRTIKGVHDPLRAQALYVRNDVGQAFLLVTVDNTGYFWELGGSGPGIREVRQRIAQATAGGAGLSPEQILITVSHSHAATDLMGFWQPFHTPIPADYLEWHADRLVEAAVAATRAPVPAQLFQGATTLTGYAGRDNGCSTVLDDTVGIVQARDATGAALATVVNYAKHPTILPETNHLASADFVWGYRSEVEAATGAPAMFVLGFEAAVHDGPEVAEIQATDDFERAYQVGKALADVTLATLPTLVEAGDTAILHREAIVPCPVEGSIVVQVYEMLGLPFRDIVREDDAYVAREVPVSWHKLGPLEIVAFPGEGTPEYSLRLRAHVVSPLAFVVAQGNDAIGYFVDPESAAADPSGQLEGYELRMGPGPRGGPTVWAAHEALGWFDGGWQGP